MSIKRKNLQKKKMHNIKEIRENPDKFQENLKKRYVDIDVKKL